MSLSFKDLLAPVNDLSRPAALGSWRWLCGRDAVPLLLTALGDLFVQKNDGAVYFLDTYEGSLKPAGASYESWKDELKFQHNLYNWFAPSLLEDLRARGLSLGEGQCYSPVHPPVMGGTMEPDNFEVSSWFVHLQVQGQLHEKLRDLPPGTPISGIDIEWN